MKSQCIKKNPKYLHEDDSYTACVFCKNRCEKAIKCASCQTVDNVFFKGKSYDMFLCVKCYHEAESRKQAKL